MGAQTSLKVSRERAMGKVIIALRDDEKLKDLLNVVLRDTLYNCYQIVDTEAESDDHRLPSE